ncbi:MAG: hypothetical protein DRO23_00615 [Thermoprotei archaeon]|nr:MAG: hypothetical protein DRO23_00615 [Thermoprotei archaeon]
MASYTIEASDFREALIHLIRQFEYELSSLEKKDYNVNIIKTLSNILSEIRASLNELSYVGGPIVNDALEKLFNKILETHDKLGLLNEEPTAKEFEKFLGSLKEMFKDFKETIVKQKITIIKRRRMLLSLLAFIALVFTVNYHLFYVLIVGADTGKTLFIIENVIPILSLIALAVLISEAFIVVKYAKYMAFLSLALTILCSYIAYLSLTTVLSVNPPSATILKITSILMLSLCILFMLMTFSYTSLITLPRVKIRVKISKAVRPVKVVTKEIPMETKNMYNILIERFKELFGELGEEMLKYEIDQYMFSGLTFEESVSKITERLGIKSKSEQKQK